MSLPQSTHTLDAVFTRYAFNKIGGRKYKDQRYKNRPFLKLLDERKKTGDGGPNIVHPVNLGTSRNGKSLARNETFAVQGNVNETWAKFTWSTVIETCFVSWWDIRESRGNKFKMQSFLDSRIDETGENLEDNIAEQVSQTTKATTEDLNTVLECVKTTGEFGGLNPSSAGQEVWKAENEDTIDWSAEGISRTRQLVQKLTDNKGKPDVILLPDTPFNETCEIGDAKVAINQDAATRYGTKYADLGLQVPFILSIPVIHDPAWNTAQSATGVVLDLSCLHLVTDPMWDMYMYPFKEMAHLGRLGQASVQLKVCQLTCSGRRESGSLTTIS